MEFALVSVILLTLVFGIIQVAFMLWAQQAASYAANAAARRNAVAPMCSGLESFVADLVGPAGSVELARPLWVSSNRERLSVTVRVKPINTGINFIPGLGTDSMVTATAVTQVENDSYAGGPC